MRQGMSPKGSFLHLDYERPCHAPGDESKRAEAGKIGDQVHDQSFAEYLHALVIRQYGERQHVDADVFPGNRMIHIALLYKWYGRNSIYLQYSVVGDRRTVPSFRSPLPTARKRHGAEKAHGILIPAAVPEIPHHRSFRERCGEINRLRN